MARLGVLAFPFVVCACSLDATGGGAGGGGGTSSSASGEPTTASSSGRGGAACADLVLESLTPGAGLALMPPSGLDGSGDFSVSAWVWPFKEPTPATGFLAPILSRYVAEPANGAGFVLFLRDDAGGGKLVLGFDVFVSTGTPDTPHACELTTTTPLPAKRWSHVAASFASGSITLYVDGAVAAGPLACAPGSVIPAARDVTVATLSDTDTSGLTGYLDDIVYRHAAIPGAFTPSKDADCSDGKTEMWLDFSQTPKPCGNLLFSAHGDLTLTTPPRCQSCSAPGSCD
jgi:hypothetical protein